MRVAWRRLVAVLTLTLAALLLVVYPARATDFSVKCWRIQSSASGALAIEVSSADTGCPVSISIADLSGAFAPGDNVPVLWNVALKPALLTTNEVGMAMPPNATIPVGADRRTTRPTQIIATYVRTCSGDADTCDPTTTPSLASPPMSGNFSTNGNPLLYSTGTREGLRFKDEGLYVVSAIAAVRDAVDPSRAYVFAAYSTVNITSGTASKTAHTKGAVRCRMSRQSALNETLDASASVSESANCELGIKLQPLSVIRPLAALDVAWTATLDQRDDAGMHMPTPLTTVELNGTSYEIVRSSLKLCKKEDACDEYTATEDLQQVVAAGPASFSSARTANFTALQVTLPAAGWYPAMLHLVIAGPNRRYDFIYYFELLATETDLSTAVDTAKYAADGNSSYCWEVLADGTQTSVASTSVAASAQDADCPYTSSLSLPTTTLASNGTLDLSWTVAQRESFSRVKFDVVNLTSVYDATTQSWATLSGLRLYACGNGTASCTPFSTDKTLLFSAPARNFSSDGTATIITAQGVKFPGPGTYTLLAHTVLPNGASRVDTATYAVVTVSSASPTTPTDSTSSSESNTVMYILIAVGCVAGVVFVYLFVVWFRKRRHRQRMEKVVRFGMLRTPTVGPPTMLKTTESRSSGPSEPFGNHEGGGSFSFTRAEPSPVSFSEQRGSLSYDPYTRSSFRDMSIEESNLSFAFPDDQRPSEVYNI